MERPARILIVEDEQLEALSLRQVLIHFGYTVTAIVASGEEAIAQVRQASPDLVLMDIHLAGVLDGIETGAQLHAHSRVPLVYLTAFDDEHLLERMKSTEPYGYLLKPYQIPELQGAIEIALYKHALAEGLHETNQKLEQEIAARREQEHLVQQLNERLLAQNESLRTSEARFHRMADNIQDGLIIIEDGRLAYVNDRAGLIFGFPQEEALRMSTTELFAPNPVPLRTLAPAGYVGVMTDEAEVWMVRKDGARRYLRYRVTADYLEGGSVQHYLALTDITERKQMEERLREASFHDALTGLYNRAFFEEEIGRLERSQRYVVSVILADVDGLKQINDQRGHQAGDELLRRAAATLRHPFRTDDVVARIGGDEFAVLLPQTDATQAETKLEHIRDDLRQHNLTHASDLPVSLSLGMATAQFHDLSLAEAIKLADDRMYQDKTRRRIARDA
jgi:diguanylate cyclase (GGDEF)-like protein/PAS domain S-box-containing protein